jgi:hypothetical protein
MTGVGTLPGWTGVGVEGLMTGVGISPGWTGVGVAGLMTGVGTSPGWTGVAVEGLIGEAVPAGGAGIFSGSWVHAIEVAASRNTAANSRRNFTLMQGSLESVAVGRIFTAENADLFSG